MITKKTLKLSLKSLRDFAKKRLPDQELIELDERDECPLEIVRHMCIPDKLGIQLLFIPEEYGGMGGGAFDVYCICEEMARIDLGVATSVFATFLGSDPITVGATPEQKKLWLSRIADEGLLFAYGATEPEAGSDLGALKTTAERVMEDGKIVGYKINGSKQWISNGGIADAYTILANTPAGPSWFIVEKGAKGFTHDKPEDKHGIRLSNTAALSLNDVYVDADRLVGGVEGQGLIQAQAVFGYTRLMVAAFGLGAGWAALDRAIPYSTKRIQAGAPLSEKQGYTHKLIVPHVVRLEAGRAYIEETAERIDAGRRQPEHRRRHRQVHVHRSRQRGGRSQHPGAGRLRLHPRIHGGEDQPRRSHHHHLRRHLRDHGDDHQPRPLAVASEDARPALSRHAREMRSAARAPSRRGRGYGGAGPARAGRSDGEGARHRLTRFQHILLRLGELIAYAECAASLARRAALCRRRPAQRKSESIASTPALGGYQPHLRARGGAQSGAGRPVLGRRSGRRQRCGNGRIRNGARLACDPSRAGRTDCRHGLRRRRAVRPRVESRTAGSQRSSSRPLNRGVASHPSPTDATATLKRHIYGKHRISSNRHRGGGSHPARRPERFGVLEKREDRPLQHHRSHSRPLGSSALLTTPIMPPRTRPTRRSAAGCASTPGIR